ELEELGQTHGGPGPQGRGESRVVVQLVPYDVAERPGRTLWVRVEHGFQRSTVHRGHGLIEDDVEADGRDPRGVQPLDQLRQAGPRPGPPAEPRETCLVDRDDHDLVAGRERTANEMTEVEKLPIEHLERNRGQQAHGAGRERYRGTAGRHSKPRPSHVALPPGSAPDSRDGWRGRRRLRRLR